MNRREFICGTGMVLGASSVTNVLLGATEDAGRGRKILYINRNWRFGPSTSDDAHKPGFDDTHFEPVTLPHSNVRLPWHGFDEKAYQFVSMYRRAFRLPPNVEGKRVFVDFAGVMTAARVWLNGAWVGEYRGGYTPFSFELTKSIDFHGPNLLAVEVDSRERQDIPPFGGLIDYMTFGGIYRDVSLRFVSQVFLKDIFLGTRDVLSRPSLDVDAYLDQEVSPKNFALEVTLTDPAGSIVGTTGPVSNFRIRSARCWSMTLENLDSISLWGIESPHLYTTNVRLYEQGQLIDAVSQRIGFRRAEFTERGFLLNGKAVKLRGLDRHQTFPFVGQAMPARVQRNDAWILKKRFHCNVVRTSHYPQSPDFLDACDELGLLAVEEIPGWQHIGDQSWKDLAIDNVERMIRRDWNRPSVILWGVRINESNDDHDFYSQTNALARRLDPTRPTGGVRYKLDSEFLEDVFTINDFGWPLAPPNHPLYLNTEFVGHTYPVKQTDDNERQREHTLRHARTHDQLASNSQYAGGIGWCAFDYNTHREFGAGDRICYHGVADIFREPKPAAGFYRSQVNPEVEIVIEPAFHWASGDEPTRFTTAMICSNCDLLRLAIEKDGKWEELGNSLPNRERFPHLSYPPFTFDLNMTHARFGDLRISGFLKDQLVATRFLSAAGVDQEFQLIADDEALYADGRDTTRVVMRVCDEFHNVRPYADAAISLRVDGPAELLGENPFVLVGGRGAVWVRAKDAPGIVHIFAEHPLLGTRSVALRLEAAPNEEV